MKLFCFCKRNVLAADRGSCLCKDRIIKFVLCSFFSKRVCLAAFFKCIFLMSAYIPEVPQKNLQPKGPCWASQWFSTMVYKRARFISHKNCILIPVLSFFLWKWNIITVKGEKIIQATKSHKIQFYFLSFAFFCQKILFSLKHFNC